MMFRLRVLRFLFHSLLKSIYSKLILWLFSSLSSACFVYPYQICRYCQGCTAYIVEIYVNYLELYWVDWTIS